MILVENVPEVRILDLAKNCMLLAELCQVWRATHVLLALGAIARIDTPRTLATGCLALGLSERDPCNTLQFSSAAATRA